MSTHNRPWYQFCPKDFNGDEKVKALSPIAELVYRRALDTMWEANACRLPNVCFKLAAALGKGLSENEFKKAWEEIQYSGFECLETTDDGKWVYSKRLKEQADRLQELSQIRSLAAKKSGKANAKQMQSKCKAKRQQMPSDTDTDTDIIIDSSESSGEGTSPPPPPSPRDKVSKCPQKDILLLYHQKFHDCPRIVAWNGINEKALQTRWREAKERQSLAWWREFFDGIRGSPFLCGVNDRGWRAKLPWIVKLENFNKILNGEYRDETPRTGVDPEDDPRNYSPAYRAILDERKRKAEAEGTADHRA